MRFAFIYPDIHENGFTWRDMNNGQGIDTETGTMNTQVIQDWTNSEVPMKYGMARDVRYKVYKEGTRLFQEIREVDNTPIHTLELPQGMALERNSYEVLLRYVLVDVVNS